ncbi:helix-turn-helix transcriptional regulator [bacterium]|nr:helix-turn-helix transcriptional regulator [bacterium]
MSQASKEVIIRNLGNNIRTMRLKRNLSQEELAFKINSARNFIGCIERAEKSPTIYTLYKIANALNTKVAELVANID